MEDIVVDVVCPIYRGFKYLPSLYERILQQKGVVVNNIVLALTLSDKDDDLKVKEFAEDKNIICFEVDAKEFSHSRTREKAIKEYCSADIVVMLSQDVILTDEYVFCNLVKSIKEKETVYNYARQICSNRSIEKYIRQKNYPETSYVISKDDIEKLQLLAFFASDACAAYDRNIFIELGGYKGYDVMMNEDQLYSKIILDAGYKKKYCADAVVEHSHRYSLKQLYTRYYETGKFYKQVKIFDQYRSTDSGIKLALYVLVEALKHFDVGVLLRWLPDMAARYLGMRKGKKSTAEK